MDAALWKSVDSALGSAELDPGVERCVRAAFASDEAVEAAMADQVEPPPPTIEAALATRPEIWLEHLEVEGFRGIGPALRLSLHPGPGLTIVQGRNGTGKSSLAEGLEVLLDGHSRRWEARRNRKEWLEGWAHLEWPGEIRIEAGLSVLGRGQVVASRRWPSAKKQKPEDAALEPSDIEDELGWARAVVQADPVLTSIELSQLPDARGVDRYKTLAHLFGLQEVDEARQRLRAVRLAHNSADNELEADTETLVTDLKQHPDEPRAVDAIEALESGPWSEARLEAVRAVVKKHPVVQDQNADNDPIRAMVHLELPSPEQVDENVKGIREQLAELAALAQTGAQLNNQLADLLRRALDHQALTGDDTCAVCGAVLDEQWRQQAQRRMEEARQTSGKVADAKKALGDFIEGTKRMIRPAPKMLSRVEPDDIGGDLLPLWKSWSACLAVDDATRFADDVERAFVALEPAVKQTRADALRHVRRLDADWSLLHAALASLAKRAGDHLSRVEGAQSATDGEQWVERLQGELRRERLAGVAQKARDIWEVLRTDSDVTLQDLVLQGGLKQPSIGLGAKVANKEKETGALAVMSQGELNALSLALFLPRATADDSPFRFVVIDDPVQAMDPHKVDGLAELLLGLAKTRQVVVLTHDPRLWNAVERSGEGATCFDIERRPGGEVTLSLTKDPTQVHLTDADRVMSAKQQVGEDVCAEVVPGLCRLALDAHLARTIRRRLLPVDGHRATEERLDKVNTTAARFALVVAGHESRRREADAWVQSQNRRLRDAAQALMGGAHGATEISPGKLIARTRELIAVIS